MTFAKKRIFPFSICSGLAFAALSACAPSLDHGAEPTTLEYTSPEGSLLHAVRPYPFPDDVCQVIKQPGSLATPVKENEILIACPKHEKGAIADRKAEGARLLAHAKHWSIFAAPQ